jgi:hypothetical protein
MCTFAPLKVTLKSSIIVMRVKPLRPSHPFKEGRFLLAFIVDKFMSLHCQVKNFMRRAMDLCYQKKERIYLEPMKTFSFFKYVITALLCTVKNKTI